MFASAASAAVSERSQDKDGAGITFSKQATAKEVGLPVYSGAKPHKDEKDDSPSVQMGIGAARLIQAGGDEIRIERRRRRLRNSTRKRLRSTARY
jgi:hypothetical protein